MSAPQPTLPLDRMRELQMLLWLYESYYGPVCGLSVVRNHVLEQLRRLATAVPALALLLLVMPAMAQEHHHPSETIYGATGRFYETWMRPDQPASSCCNRHDCEVAIDVRKIEGRWWARKKSGGPLMSIPPEKIEQMRDSPDGQSHVCSVGSTVLCFLPGGGT